MTDTQTNAESSDDRVDAIGTLIVFTCLVAMEMTYSLAAFPLERWSPTKSMMGERATTRLCSSAVLAPSISGSLHYSTWKP